MEEILYKATNMLFKAYEQYGNYNEKDEFKLLALIVIRDMLMFDYDGYLEDRDIIDIEKAINSILGDGCLFGFEVKDIKCCD